MVQGSITDAPGVRTKSWTTCVVRKGVRMYDRDGYGSAMYALDEGMTPREAADIVRCSRCTVAKWRKDGPPHTRGSASKRQLEVAKGRRKRSEMDVHEPPKKGPLAGLAPDQIENLLLRAVLADLKVRGWDPASISNRRKCELGERLRKSLRASKKVVCSIARLRVVYRHRRRHYSSYAQETAGPGGLTGPRNCPHSSTHQTLVGVISDDLESNFTLNQPLAISAN